MFPARLGAAGHAQPFRGEKENLIRHGLLLDEVLPQNTRRLQSPVKKNAWRRSSRDSTSPSTTWFLKACAIDRRIFKEIRDDLLNLSHASVEVLQLAVVCCQAEIETNGYRFAANMEIPG